MPVAVSPTKVRSTYVTDIRYREDAADLDKPEDLPVSIIFAAFGNKSLGIKRRRHSFLSFHFVLLLLFLS
jgi:hypothetical protein